MESSIGFLFSRLFKITKKKNSLRKSDEDYFIDKLKPLLNKKTWVAKPSKAAGS